MTGGWRIKNIIILDISEHFKTHGSFHLFINIVPLHSGYAHKY